MIVLDKQGSIPIRRRDVTWDELRRFLSSFLTEYYPETAVRLADDGVTVRGKPVGPLKRCYAAYHISLRVIEGEVHYALKGTLSPSHAAMLAWALGGIVLAPFAFCCCLTILVGFAGVGFELLCYEVVRNESREFIESALAAMEHHVSEETDPEDSPWPVGTGPMSAGVSDESQDGNSGKPFPDQIAED
jgi:hypothetical protein